MSFEKVVDVIRGIVREEDDVTIEFTFLELKQFLERSKSRSTTGYQASTTATAPQENPQEISTEKNKSIDEEDQETSLNDETPTPTAAQTGTPEQLPTDVYDKEDEQAQQTHTEEPSSASATCPASQTGTPEQLPTDVYDKEDEQVQQTYTEEP